MQKQLKNISIKTYRNNNDSYVGKCFIYGYDDSNDTYILLFQYENDENNNHNNFFVFDPLPSYFSKFKIDLEAISSSNMLMLSELNFNSNTILVPITNEGTEGTESNSSTFSVVEKKIDDEFFIKDKLFYNLKSQISNLVSFEDSLAIFGSEFGIYKIMNYTMNNEISSIDTYLSYLKDEIKKTYFIDEDISNIDSSVIFKKFISIYINTIYSKSNINLGVNIESIKRIYQIIFN